MIAIPDFALGAMENWGLITYRETAMLYTPGVSSEANKQRVTQIIAHELTHQVGTCQNRSKRDNFYFHTVVYHVRVSSRSIE